MVRLYILFHTYFRLLGRPRVGTTRSNACGHPPKEWLKQGTLSVGSSFTEFRTEPVMFRRPTPWHWELRHLLGVYGVVNFILHSIEVWGLVEADWILALFLYMSSFLVRLGHHLARSDNRLARLENVILGLSVMVGNYEKRLRKLERRK